MVGICRSLQSCCTTCSIKGTALSTVGIKSLVGLVLQVFVRNLRREQEHNSAIMILFVICSCHAKLQVFDLPGFLSLNFRCLHGLVVAM